MIPKPSGTSYQQHLIVEIETQCCKEYFFFKQWIYYQNTKPNFISTYMEMHICLLHFRNMIFSMLSLVPSHVDSYFFMIASLTLNTFFIIVGNNIFPISFIFLIPSKILHIEIIKKYSIYYLNKYLNSFTKILHNSANTLKKFLCFTSIQ